MNGMKWELNGLMRDWNLLTTSITNHQPTLYKFFTKPALLSRERGTIAGQKGYFYPTKGQVLQHDKKHIREYRNTNGADERPGRMTKGEFMNPQKGVSATLYGDGLVAVCHDGRTVSDEKNCLGVVCQKVVKELLLGIGIEGTGRFVKEHDTAVA